MIRELRRILATLQKEKAGALVAEYPTAYTARQMIRIIAGELERWDDYVEMKQATRQPGSPRSW